MTTAKRKKVITIETFERTVIRQISNQTQTLWCEFCQVEIEMATPEFAARLLDVSQRDVFRRIEKGELHFIENENDSLLICVNSLKTT